MPDFNELDRQVLDALDGRDRIKVLLKSKGLELKDFAQKHNLWVQQVSYCLGGEREYPEIREALAAELADFGVDRATIDQWIPFERAA